MSNTKKPITEATLKSVIKCLEDKGYQVGAVELTTNGTVRVLTAAGASELDYVGPNPFDEPKPDGRH